MLKPYFTKINLFKVALILSASALTLTKAYKSKFNSADDYKRILSQRELKKDIDLLVYTFENGYGGKDYLKTEVVEFTNTLKRVIADYPNGLELYKLQIIIDESLKKIPDGHLAVSADEPARTERSPASLDATCKTNKESHFEELNLQGKKTLVATIPSFLISDQANQKNLVDTFSEKLSKSDSLILDLRGNRGGYENIPLQLAARLWGEPYREENTIQYYPMPIKLTNYLKNKLVYTLWSNNETEFENRKIPTQEEDFLAYTQEDLNLYLDDPPHLQENGFPKPIYILVDGYCASACERMLEATEMHPNVKVIGEKTAGAVQFGGVGTLALPESHLIVSIPTGRIEYTDNRKVEKIGYTPSILVGKEEDALTKAVSLLKTNL